MGIMGDRFEGTFEDHKIELVRTNIDKKVVVTVEPHEPELRSSSGVPQSYAGSYRSTCRLPPAAPAGTSIA